jgi:hypothetical protein
MGVINDPPPTPVKPTMTPTKNPAKTNANSCMGATVGGLAYIENYFFAISIFLK